mgnify:CR=1 FL=1
MKTFIQEIGSRRLFHKRLIDVFCSWARRELLWARRDPGYVVLIVLVVILLALNIFDGIPHAVEHSPLLIKIFR